MTFDPYTADAHVDELCRQYGLTRHISHETAPDGLPTAYSIPMHSLIQVPRAYTEANYLSCLHEVGHCVCGHKPPILTPHTVLNDEAEAWEVALHTTLFPVSPNGRQHICRCLGSYVHSDFPHPPRDSKFWTMLQTGSLTTARELVRS